MQFIARKRRAPPTVIIVSLIDVLIVVLIFLMVTTTFKQQPAVKLSLPSSTQAKPGANENTLVVTITKQGMLFLKTEAVTAEKLRQDLVDAARANPNIMLAIRADNDAPWGQVVKVRDAAQAAHITSVNAWVNTGKTP
jgi:biopolymer transport protein ExbD